MTKKDKRDVGARLGHRVSINPLKGHPRYKWRATFADDGGLKQKYFKTKVNAQAFAEDREDDALAHGVNESLSSSERAAVQDTRERLAALGLPLRKAINFAADYFEKADRSCTVGELAEKVVSVRERAGQSTRHINDLRSKLGKFAASFGNRPVSTLTTDEIADWLHGLKLSPASINSYRRILVVAFNDAVRDGYIEANPAEMVKQSKVVETEVGILTPHQVSALLQAADEKILPAIAIEAFAGVRRAEIERMDWSEVDLTEGVIRIKASKAKSSRNRLIAIPANLKAWLTPLAKTKGRIWPSNGRKIWEAAQANGGIAEWPHNALRHSFASYHLAYHKNIEELSLLLGHTDTRIVFQHYRSLVTAKDAASYWGIKPASVSNVVQMNGVGYRSVPREE